MQMQLCAGTVVEKASQQPKCLGRWAQVADHDSQRALFAHRKLRRVRLESVELMQKNPHASVERSSGIRQRNAVARAIEELQTELRLEPLDGRKHGGLRSVKLVSAPLESSFGY